MFAKRFDRAQQRIGSHFPPRHHWAKAFGKRLPCVLLQRRLVIEQIHLARAAIHEQLNHRLCLRRMMRLLRRQIIQRLLAQQILRKQLRQSRAHQPIGNPGKEIAPCRHLGLNQYTETPPSSSGHGTNSEVPVPSTYGPVDARKVRWPPRSSAFSARAKSRPTRARRSALAGSPVVALAEQAPCVAAAPPQRDPAAAAPRCAPASSLFSGIKNS